VLIEHRGAVPEIHPTAYIAPTGAAERMSRQSAWFAAHLDDRVLDSSDGQ
jgi:hypothetical protein